jgi:phosphatidylserine decarboxylase
LKTWLLTAPVLLFAAYFYWRYFWFFRNPRRYPPAGEHILSPADGTVVYVQRLEPQEKVISIKKGMQVSLTDIVQEDLARSKILIGIFMSPFNVHYNRMPVIGKVEFIHHHPARSKNHHMASMHWRTALGRTPFFQHSRHIIENERKVTKVQGEFRQEPLPYYVIQIAAKSVNGIDSFIKVGETIETGQIFGMIRIGSQVDLVVPDLPGMQVKVKPGEKVRAGETILIT